jgi:hypothetical protein
MYEFNFLCVVFLDSFDSSKDINNKINQGR